MREGCDLMTWKKFNQESPELAAHGYRLLNGHIAYLALLNRDGSPRVHPVRPFIGWDMLFIFTNPASPKISDFERDRRYALHASVPDSGPFIKFLIMGKVDRIKDPNLRVEAEAIADPLTTIHNYVLFEFIIHDVLMVEYKDSQNRSVRRWSNIENWPG